MTLPESEQSPAMEYDRYAVVKIRGADPEAFLILLATSGHSKPGFLWTTSQALTESEVRDELAKMGHTEAQINSLIEKARENPV